MATLAVEVVWERRERVFLVLAGTFLCAMTLLNVIGITRFVQLGPMALAVGVLPYPLTFLCTDLVCELYGRARANFLVSVGLGLNFFILFVLFLGDAIPSVAAGNMPPWQVLQLAQPVVLPNGDVVRDSVGLYQLIYATTSGRCLHPCSPTSPPSTATCNCSISGSGSPAASTCGCATISAP
ncbi:VUT family protein [Kineobactrum salinum]|uniref:VUT family protein n=1 Tax=Kineobactrum salinum TaxID=2708301 RepID=UPI0022B29C39|nr:VUT family protein [Kineobactrum salinum]